MIVYKFIGLPGSYVVGAPSRDITQEMIDSDPEMVLIVETNSKTSNPLYERVKQVKVKPVEEK